MPRVFISYSTKDAVFADLAKMKLNADGIEVWLDETNLHGGDEWRGTINRGITESDALLVILTPASCKSLYVTYEWGFALGLVKKVVPLLREDSDVHPRLEGIQHLDFRDHRNGPWEDLGTEIRKVVGTASQKSPVALVGQMTSQQLIDLITGAVALATATAKNGQGTEEQNISSAAKNMVGAIQQNASRGREDQKRHILWVDDKPKNNVYEWEALEKLRDRTFSAIISDMWRKEGSREGYVLLEAVRRFDTKTPFFIYGGSAQQHAGDAISRGAHGATNSPIELIQWVSKNTR